MLIPQDVTAAYDYLFDHGLHNPPAVVSESSFRPPLANIFFGKLVQVTTSAKDAVIPQLRQLDPWLNQTLEDIALHRGLTNDWDGQMSAAPDEALFETAEIIASQFAQLPVHWRPTLTIDSDGRPNFAAYNDDLYLSLTVDEPGVISWYSVVDGKENFRDEVVIGQLEFGGLKSEIFR